MDDNRKRDIVKDLSKIELALDKLSAELSADRDVPPVVARAFIQSSVSLSVTSAMFNSIHFCSGDESCHQGTE